MCLQLSTTSTSKMCPLYKKILILQTNLWKWKASTLLRMIFDFTMNRCWKQAKRLARDWKLSFTTIRPSSIKKIQIITHTILQFWNWRQTTLSRTNIFLKWPSILIWVRISTSKSWYADTQVKGLKSNTNNFMKKGWRVLLKPRREQMDFYTIKIQPKREIAEDPCW